MLNKIIKKVLGTSHEREMRRLQPMVERINSFEAAIAALSTPQLQAKTAEFRERLSRGEHVDALNARGVCLCT